MPIYGLTDRPGQGFDRIAKLYKGGEKETRTKNGKEYEVVGKDLNYFRIEFEPQHEHLREIWEAMYGVEPDEFQGVFLTAPTTDEAFQAWKEEWNASATLLHRCDGENQTAWYNADAGINMRSKKACEVNNGCGCKETGRIDLVLPDFCAESGVLGVITLTTHSVFDIMAIHGRLKMLERINGSLIGVPLVIGRAPREINVPRKDANGKQSRMKTTKSLIYINPTTDFTKGRLIPTLAGVIAPQLMATGTENVAVGNEPVREIRLADGKRERRVGGHPNMAIVDPFANLRAALDEVEISIRTIQERTTPNTYHVILDRAVTDVTKFREWLCERFGAENVLNVGGEWIDLKWAQEASE